MTVLRSDFLAPFAHQGDHLVFRIRHSRAGGTFTALCAVLCLLQLPLAHSAMPPLIDRNLLFDDPEISGAQISRDGQFLAFLKPLNGTKNIWVKRTRDSLDKAHPITAVSERPVPAYFWSRDSRYILFPQDNSGDENFNVYAVRPWDAPAPGSLAPVAHDLTRTTGVHNEIVWLPRGAPNVVYVGMND